MQNLWNSAESERWNSNELEARVYSARLLGQEPDLGCAVAGAISVKVTEKSFFGEPAELVYVQAAGTNLANVAPDQLIPLRRDHLLRLLNLPSISTRDLEHQLRLASNHPDSPTPAVSALLHAAIPAKYVDQAGADAILSLINTPRTAELMRSIFGPTVLWIPYFHSEFDLAKAAAAALANPRNEKPTGLAEEDARELDSTGGRLFPQR